MTELSHFQYRYDPRVLWSQTATMSPGATLSRSNIGIGYTFDFEKFTFLENALLPFNVRCIVSAKDQCKYFMLSRQAITPHTVWRYLFESKPDLIHWGCHRFVMETKGGWQARRLARGRFRLNSRSWLLFYHGVLTSCNGFVYSFGAALLDLDQPWKVFMRRSFICFALRLIMNASVMCRTWLFRAHAL